MKFSTVATSLVATGVTALAHEQLKLVTEMEKAPVPFYSEKTMPAVSTTLLCIMNLATQYFVCYTALAIARTLEQLYGGYANVASLCATACSTVVYAPVLSVLFLGTRMRAIQLTQGETEKYELPQPWAQEAMQVASWSVLAQVAIIVAMPLITGSWSVPVDDEGNIDPSKLKVSDTVIKVMTIIKYLTLTSLYTGVAVVIYGVFTMEAPKEIYGGGTPPVSPAVACTVNLSCQFMTVYLLVAVVKSLLDFRINGPMVQKFQGALKLATFTVNFAPMLSILFVGARMRALQMDPKNGAPQPWAQNCFYACTYSILFQTVMVLALPFIYPDVKCKQGAFEGDVIFEGLTGVMGQILTGLRWAAVLATYGGFTAVMYSVFVITAKEGPTPPLSPAMSCVMNLSTQYFTIYLVIFLWQTTQQYLGTGAKVQKIMEQARGTVMYAPMLSMLFIGCRMRALQLTKSADGTIPSSAGPQSWAQDCMFLSTWSVLIQVLLVIGLSMWMGDVEVDEDGNAKTPTSVSPWIGYTLNFLRYFCMISMYGGACVIVYAVGVMTPETLPPYAKPEPLVPGAPDIPQPPNPPTAKMF